MDMISKIISLLTVCIIALALIIFIPLCVIWSLNTLFNLHIAYSLTNWGAMSFLYFTWRGATHWQNKKNN
jgi:hypothetical protein